MHSHRHTPANFLYRCWHEVHKSLIWNWNLPRTPIWSNMKVTRHRPVLLPQRQIILEMYFYKLCTIFYSSLQLSWRWRKYSRQKVSILAVLPTIIKRISDDCVFIIIKLFFNLKKKKNFRNVCWTFCTFTINPSVIALAFWKSLLVALDPLFSDPLQLIMP